MGVALVVVPGIVAAWLWIAPAGRGRCARCASCSPAAAAMVARRRRVAAARRTHARGRPPVDVGHERQQHPLADLRLQRPRPRRRPGGRPRRGGGGSMFGGTPGPLRLLNSALGGQAGWLLGFALVGGARRCSSRRACGARDARSGWLIAVGGAFLTTAVLFSFASGIFHPYYVVAARAVHRRARRARAPPQLHRAAVCARGSSARWRSPPASSPSSSSAATTRAS